VVKDEYMTTRSHFIYYDSASLHVYFALLVVIICCVIFYVLLKWKIKKVESKSNPSNLYPGFRYPSSVYSPLSQSIHHSFRAKCHPLKEDAALQVTALIPDSIKPEQNISNPGVVVTMSESRCNNRYSDLAATKKRVLEACLDSNREGDWKCLAKQLDFSVESFAEKPGPTRHLLQSWSKREGRKATVGVLVMALIRLGRLDAAFILDPTCIRNHPSFSSSGLFI